MASWRLSLRQRRSQSGRTQAWLFPIFPWAAFCVCGLAAGFVLLVNGAAAAIRRRLHCSHRGRGLHHLGEILRSFAGADLSGLRYWHTSPKFFSDAVGLLLLIAFFATRGVSGDSGRAVQSLIQLGQTSLLVYWVHMSLSTAIFVLRDRVWGSGRSLDCWRFFAGCWRCR